MTFIRKNSYSIFKIMLNQFGMMVLAMILIGAASATDNPTIRLLGSIYTTVFFMALLYVMMWECGGRDRIRVDGGRDVYDRFAGVKMALCANLPTYLIVLFLTVGYLFGSLWMQEAWAQGMFAIAHGVAAFTWDAMYSGIIMEILDPATTSSISPAYILAYALSVLPSVAACAFGYGMGYRGKRIFGGLSQKKK